MTGSLKGLPLCLLPSYGKVWREKIDCVYYNNKEQISLSDEPGVYRLNCVLSSSKLRINCLEEKKNHSMDYGRTEYRLNFLISSSWFPPFSISLLCLQIDKQNDAHLILLEDNKERYEIFV